MVEPNLLTNRITFDIKGGSRLFSNFLEECSMIHQYNMPCSRKMNGVAKR